MSSKADKLNSIEQCTRTDGAGEMVAVLHDVMGNEVSPATVYAEALAAAKAAVAAAGPEDTRAFNCGFGWVTIHPARGPLVKYLKSNQIGDNGWAGGWWIENPGQFGGQQVDQKYAGAKAFADALARYGISATASSRLD